MKRTLITVTMITVILTALPVWAQTETDFEVKQNADNTLTITGYTGTVKNIVIPSTLYGLKVTGIDDGAFAYKELTSVVIPDTITTIGTRYFQNIPGTFQGNKLIKVTLGSGITIIPYGAFRDNQTLTKIEIPDSVVGISGDSFQNCGLTNIVFSKNLQYIDREAFRNNRITELILPVGLKTISMDAFAFNQIRSLIIPDGVTKIYQRAFMGNPIEILVIPPSLAKYNSDNHGNYISGIADNAFNNSSITRITLPEGMSERVLQLNFDRGLVNFWNNQNKAAGTYVKKGPI